MTLAFFKQQTQNTEVDPYAQKAKLHLTQLAEFIQTEKNSDLLYQKNGHIDFSTFESTIKHFDCNNDSSIRILTHALENYDSKLQKLQTVDKTLVLTLTFGLVASLLSPLMLGFGAIASAAAFIYLGMQYQQRQTVQEEYKAAQTDMTNVYIWIMNDQKAKLTSNSGILSNTTNTELNKLHSKVTEMHKVFNPMLSDADIAAYTRNDLELAVIEKEKAKNDKAIENESTSKLQLSLSYLLYGQDQGSALQISKGILSLCGQTLWSIGIHIKDGVLSITGMSEESIKDSAIGTAMNFMK